MEPTPTLHNPTPHVRGLRTRLRQFFWRLSLLPRRFLGDRLLGKILFHSRLFSGNELLFCGLLSPQERRFLFDPGFYASQYLGALDGRKGLAAHLLAYGLNEHAWPSPLFDPDYYCRTYPDVAASRVNPLTHYVLFGAREGRNPHALFDASYYASQAAQQGVAVSNPICHFMTEGRHRGWRCHPSAPNHAYAGPFDVLCETAAFASQPLAYKAESAYWPGVRSHEPARKPFSSLEEEAATFPLEKRALWLQDLKSRPHITVVVPVSGSGLQRMERLCRSLARQIYPEWDAVFVDAAGVCPDLARRVQRLSEDCPHRCKVLSLPAPQGRAAALIAAFEAATGEFVCILEPEDALAPHALLEVARAISQDPTADAVYTDSDLLDTRGRLSCPVYKPAWSPEYFRHADYVGRLLALRRERVRELGGFNPAFEGIEEYELLLRLSERTPRILHVPVIACHCGLQEESYAGAPDAASQLTERQARAVAEHLRRCGIEADVRPDPVRPRQLYLQPRLISSGPLVSILIPTRNQAALLSQCLESIYQKSAYRRFEVVLIDNASDEPDAFALYERHPVRVIPFHEPFNFSRAINLALGHCEGSYLLLLNNDTEVLTPDWLEQMLFYAQRPDVGAVGALLLFPDGRIQHAGVALGTRARPHHIFRLASAADLEKSGLVGPVREVTAVTGACMMIKREDYEQLGGLREFYQDIFQDVDLCMRLLEKGRRNLLNPRARLLHHESVSRGERHELRDCVLFAELWKNELAAGDRYLRTELAWRGARKS